MFGHVSAVRRRSPSAGSCTTIAPLRAMRFSTTKWLMSQCRIAGKRSRARLIGFEAQRPADQADAFRGFDDTGQRHALERDGVAAAQAGEVDVVGRGTAAIIARQARPHSAVSDWRMSGRRRPHSGPPSYRPAAHGAQWFQHPVEQRAPIEHDAGFQRHVRVERKSARMPAGLLVEHDNHRVRRFVADDRPDDFGRTQQRARHGAHRAAMHAEPLVGKRLVGDAHVAGRA